MARAADGLLGPPKASTSRSERQPPMGLTENDSPTFLSSGDPCVDFFFQVVPNTPAKVVNALLAAAWAENPLTALKLVCHLRAVRGTGKSDRKGFYAAALWLHQRHPKTLASNVGTVANFGYLKDLPEILHLIVAGPNTRKRIPAKYQPEPPRRLPRRRKLFRKPKARASIRFKPKKMGCRSCRCKICRCERRKVGRSRGKVARRRLSGRTVRERINYEAEEAATLRHQKRATMAANSVKRYAGDANYHFLHDQTSELFASLLSSDLQLLKSGDMKHFSLAAKWCPSLDSSYDRSTLLCEAIARRLFPRNSDPEYLKIEEQHYAYRVRDRLRKEVLVPLRRALRLPEVYICAGQWGSIPYSRVASVAMKNYKEQFMSRDKMRFSEFLGQVKKGKAKIAAGALLPHEIMTPAMDGEEDEVAELQWQRMVSDLSEKGKLSNCIAVCDVSGSMGGTPIQVCVALGLLISELSEEPWKGRVITFSENPQMHHIRGETLREKATFVKKMDWGNNTNFQRVFDQILDLAVKGKLEANKMIKRLFVFSDMEFDEASGNQWETDYRAICRKFEKRGYPVPEIVFWNLSDSSSTPVTSEQKGAALVSGFSKNQVKLFLNGDGVLTPRAVMEAAIAGEEYKKLEVFD